MSQHYLLLFFSRVYLWPRLFCEAPGWTFHLYQNQLLEDSCQNLQVESKMPVNLVCVILTLLSGLPMCPWGSHLGSPNPVAFLNSTSKWF